MIRQGKMENSLIEDVTCVILCGGRSLRMGTDKTVIPFKGKALLEHVIKTAKEVFKNIAVSIRDISPCENAGLPIIKDEFEVQSPLSGIHACLKNVNTDRIVVFAVDMPLVKPDVLRLLTRYDKSADVVIPRIQGYLEPLLASYSTNCIEFIEKRYNEGFRKVVSFFDDVNVRVIDEKELVKVDPKLRSFININNKAGLKAIEALSLVDVV